MIRSIIRDFSAAMEARGLKGVVGTLKLAFLYLVWTWLLNNLLPFMPYGLTVPLHRARGVTIGDGCFIDPTVIIDPGHADRITIGDDVRITARAVIMAHILPSYHLRETNLVPRVLSHVVIEDHAFIGVNAVIMPGVTIGKGAVVASGAVVFTNVPPYTMVLGNPAKKFKKLTGDKATDSTPVAS